MSLSLLYIYLRLTARCIFYRNSIRNYYLSTLLSRVKESSERNGISFLLKIKLNKNVIIKNKKIPDETSIITTIGGGWWRIKVYFLYYIHVHILYEPGPIIHRVIAVVLPGWGGVGVDDDEEKDHVDTAMEIER